MIDDVAHTDRRRVRTYVHVDAAYERRLPASHALSKSKPIVPVTMYIHTDVYCAVAKFRPCNDSDIIDTTNIQVILP